MKLGIVGTGKIVKEVLSMVPNVGFDQVYLYGRREEAVEELASKFSINRTFTDYKEFLQSDVDAVYIGLPNTLHFFFAKEAFQADKHVILEKPITVTVAELEELMALAKEKNKFLFEAMSIHHLPAYRALQEQLKAIGDIKIAMFEYSQYSSRYDAFLQGEILPAFDVNQAGGALMDINVYNIHGAVNLFGAPEGVHYFPNVFRNVDTSGVLVMNYDGFQTVCIGAKDNNGSSHIAIQGEKGSVLINSSINHTDSFTVKLRNGEEEEYSYGLSPHRLYWEFCEFLRIMEEGDTEAADKLLNISYESMKVLEEGRNVVLDGNN